MKNNSKVRSRSEQLHVIVLSPNIDRIWTPTQKRTLANKAHVSYFTQPQALTQITELQSDMKKIIALDPDFCGWEVPDCFSTQSRNIQAVCLQTTSFSWLNVALAKQLGITIVNIVDWSTPAVAEWALMGALCLARKVPLIVKNEWREDYSQQLGCELRGKVAGIIGLGHIGKQIAVLCQCMGMRVIYWSEHSRDERYWCVSLPKLMKSADVVFPCLAQNEQTQGLLSDELLRSMKPQAMFVSIVHQIYNHKLLLKQVAENKLFGYAFENEEPTNDFNQFVGNVWAGPSLAWYTDTALQRNGELWLQNVLKEVG